jgi:3-isopropylmalate/(R)-2-methylmalate dehydratase small subunit
MQPFRTHKGKVAPLDRANVDTDQIIPKQFLKRIERTGFGEFLFYDWRRGEDGGQDPSFTLNQPRYKGASILVAGKNFGCGSSREHAVWALEDFGFRAVIAPSFADIFANNCVKNGVLTVVLSAKKVEEILRRARELPNYQLALDLEQCKVHDDTGFSASFRIDDFTRHCLLEGLDDIGLTLQHEPEITAYESRHPAAKNHVGAGRSPVRRGRSRGFVPKPAAPAAPRMISAWAYSAPDSAGTA